MAEEAEYPRNYQALLPHRQTCQPLKHGAAEEMPGWWRIRDKDGRCLNVEGIKPWQLLIRHAVRLYVHTVRCMHLVNGARANK